MSHLPFLLQGTFLNRGHDSVIADIEARIAKWTLMPAGNGEGLQVLVSVGWVGQPAGAGEQTNGKELPGGGERACTCVHRLSSSWACHSAHLS